MSGECTSDPGRLDHKEVAEPYELVYAMPSGQKRECVAAKDVVQTQMWGLNRLQSVDRVRLPRTTDLQIIDNAERLIREGQSCHREAIAGGGTRRFLPRIPRGKRTDENDFIPALSVQSGGLCVEHRVGQFSQFAIVQIGFLIGLIEQIEVIRADFCKNGQLVYIFSFHGLHCREKYP